MPYAHFFHCKAFDNVLKSRLCKPSIYSSKADKFCHLHISLFFSLKLFWLYIYIFFPGYDKYIAVIVRKTV